VGERRRIHVSYLNESHGGERRGGERRRIHVPDAKRKTKGPALLLKEDEASFALDEASFALPAFFFPPKPKTLYLTNPPIKNSTFEHGVGARGVSKPNSAFGGRKKKKQGHCGIFSHCFFAG
jgi:hypothetical protein